MKEIEINNVKIKVENFIKHKDRKYFIMENPQYEERIGEIFTIDDFIQLRNFLNDVINEF